MELPPCESILNTRQGTTRKADTVFFDSGKKERADQ